MGLSGVSIWGSDIGGFFALFEPRARRRELLIRWIQLGAVSGVMRTQANGFALPDKARAPQICDDDDPAGLAALREAAHAALPVPRGRRARVPTQTGLPIMRHLALAYPGDAAAAARDDEFLFGPDLLAAPVIEPGATERTLYLPRGRWVDLWRGALRPTGGRCAWDARGRSTADAR